MGDMESGNSGSMQSSSTGGGGGGGGCGDDQEYDSRNGGIGSGGESITAFFNSMSRFNNMGSGGGSSGGGVPLQLYSLSNNGSSSFTNNNTNNSQVPNYFDHSHQPPTLSQSSSLDCPNFMINHNSNNNNNGTNNDNNNQVVDMVWPNKFHSIRPSLSTDDPNCTEGPFGYTIPNNNNNHHHQHQQNPPRPLPLPLPSPGPPPPPLSSTAPTITGGSGRNPKKRSRASRRAPTTVLTTDTNNFRQMVQEFTGIPSPPFTAFSTRARFDLFGGLGGLTASSVPPPSYLLRPFPQKIPPLQQPPYLANNNSSLPSPHTTTTPTTNTIDGLGSAAAAASTEAASTSNNSSSIAAASANFHSMCDPQHFLSSNTQLSFQSLLEQTSSALDDHHNNQQNSSMNLGCNTVTPHQTSCSVVNPSPGSYLGISTITSAAVNGGASDNNVGATKGEGMIDSWICSSD